MYATRAFHTDARCDGSMSFEIGVFPSAIGVLRWAKPRSGVISRTLVWCYRPWELGLGALTLLPTPRRKLPDA